jgi:hypothetical protein
VSTKVPQRVAVEILVNCGRHCCVCRRFRPLHLHVHHIIERGEGGSDDPDNLIATCVSCHCDIHTVTLLTRRFTPAELKQHRDNVYKLVADGKLVGGDSEADATSLSAAIVHKLLPLLSGTPPARPDLMADAVEILTAAATGNIAINVVDADPGFGVLVGGQQFGDFLSERESARYKHAISELRNLGLIEGGPELFHVSYSGLLLADDILSAGGTAPTE